MKKIILSLMTVVIMLISINGVLSFGPNTHLNITETCIEQADAGLIKQLIENNWDACLSGVEYPDVAIFEYFSNFKSYKGMHSYNTVEEMLRIAKNDRERTFAYCYKIHLAEDAISHNYFVPLAIKKTKLPNYIVHILQEAAIEGFYLNIRANRMMENHGEFDAFVAQASGRDWTPEATKLNTLIGGGQFYTKAYVPSSTTWIGKAQNSMFKGISYFVPPTTGVDYYKLAISECKSVLRGETGQLDPSGDAALAQADSESAIWLWGITIGIMIISLFLSWRFKVIGFSRN